ncbi:MAG: peptidoglycan recognition family protein, partial [Planctomycetota bacterium]|nr:peptidoglycan recognition family protein [Planctomycetota bacterium]
AQANARNLTPASGRWSWITVHLSVVASASDSLSASLDTVRRIQREHMNRSLPYGDIGYHFLIDRAGRIIEGRKLRWQGAHAGGANNRGNVGICLIGNFEVEEPTRAAINALERLVFELQSELGIPRRNVKPHLEWKETKCPGKNLMPWFARR